MAADLNKVSTGREANVSKASSHPIYAYDKIVETTSHSEKDLTGNTDEVISDFTDIDIAHIYTLMNVHSGSKNRKDRKAAP